MVVTSLPNQKNKLPKNCSKKREENPAKLNTQRGDLGKNQGKLDGLKASKSGLGNN